MDENCLSITTGSGHLNIKRPRKAGGIVWGIRWIINGEMLKEEGMVTGEGEKELIKGYRGFFLRHLLTAFDVPEHPNSSHPSLAKRFDAEHAVLGKFIRVGDFLNIPGPGTGMDGDANLSVHLNEWIREESQRFLLK
jgi:hypothetical protein